VSALQGLKPEQFGQEVHDAVLRQAQRLAFNLGFDLHDSGVSNIRITGEALCLYAQTGEEPGDAPIVDYLQSLAEALYRRAADGSSYSVSDLDEGADPETSWGLVVVGTAARDAIAKRKEVTAAQLAVLAGLESSSLRRLAAEGDVTPINPAGRPLRFEAKEARRWLGGRGVAGFDGHAVARRRRS